jgi:hypothetical protein
MFGEVGLNDHADLLKASLTQLVGFAKVFIQVPFRRCIVVVAAEFRLADSCLALLFSVSLGAEKRGLDAGPMIKNPSALGVNPRNSPIVPPGFQSPAANRHSP